MQIDITTPACLFLGLTHCNGQICQMGVTLQYPPVQLLARPAAELTITGGRADLAHEQAARFFKHYQVRSQDEVEIELAIPSFMGLGSSSMLGLSIAATLARLHAIPVDNVTDLAAAVGLAQDEALEAHAFAQGGVLLVGQDGALVERREIAHTSEDDDWVFVLVLPRVPSGTAETLEAERRAALQIAAQHLDTNSANAIAGLWRAIKRNTIAGFARALAATEAWNQAALADSGQPQILTPDEQAILDIMRANGALHCGRALAGLSLYGLVKSGSASRTLRRTLAEHVGLFGGTVMASVCDNRGAQVLARL